MDDPGEIQALVYSVAIQTGENFQLSDSSYTDSLLTQPADPEDGYIIRRIRQPWPDYLPFEFYVDRLRKLSRAIGLTCDCIQSGNEEQLLCTVGSGAFIGAQIVVERQRRTILSGREIAFVFWNLGTLSDDKIMEILDHNIAFSYFTSSDIYPSRRMKKTLEKAGIVSIIELPTDISNLVEPGLSGTKQTSRNKRNSKQMSHPELVRILFERHPNPGAVSFRRSGGLDSGFVRSAIELAGDAKIAYLYDNSTPDGIDSLAYSSGLTMITMKSVADFRDNSIGEIRPLLLNNLISSQNPIRMTILFDASKLNVKEFIDLHNNLRRLGINILSCILLADIKESL